MSDDNWEQPKPSGLPGEGDGWTERDSPQPLHDMSREQWGTAPSHTPQQPPYQQPRQQPPQQQPPYQQPHAMRPAPQHNLQPTSTLDGNDAIAIVLNFFIPGVGYMMLGQTVKGIAILLGTYLTCGAGYLLTVLFVLDAYMVAQARKSRPVGDWEFFPK